MIGRTPDNQAAPQVPLPPTEPPAIRIRGLIQLALAGLDDMRLDDGTFCRERIAGQEAPTGRSLRYSLMCEIGLAAASRAGYAHELGGERLPDALLAEITSPELTPGDLGLYLWLDALTDGSEGDRLLDELVRRLAEEGGLPAREGLELGWIVHGLAISADRLESPLLHEALDVLLQNQAGSALFAHYGDGRQRSRFPNFATQVYSILALATVAKLGLDDRAAPAASRAADRVLMLQLADGGWPWLYDARSGNVVEPYEIYSVHQHAMAPMALLQLWEVTGHRRYLDAVANGLSWISGRNELNLNMVDEQERLIYRSIRRRRPFDRALLYANTAGARLTGRSMLARGFAVELLPTCRPYELGWLLEAWCGREDVVSS